MGVHTYIGGLASMTKEKELSTKKNPKKKKWIIASIIVLVIAIGGYITNMIIDNRYSYEAKKFVKEHPEEAIAFAKKVDKIDYNIKINSSSEADVLATMNQMCHQKIVAKDKWGAVPMIPSTINDIFQIVDRSDFETRTALLQILEKWLQGDFSTVDRDHDYILKLQNGSIGFSKGKATPEEEAQFILEHFGRDID